MQQNQIGNFIKQQFLGRGTSARVYKGCHVDHQNLPVAIKEFNTNKESLAQFNNEATALCYLQKVCQEQRQQMSFINRILAWFQYQNELGYQVPVIVLEYAPKGELFDYLAECTVFQTKVAANYCRQLVEAVYQLHTLNVAHRDLKPQNILLDQHYQLKLSDFGISTGYCPGQLNYDSVGTNDYMAPEVLIGKPYDAKSADIFSLGIILCLIYTSIHPFRCNCCDEDNIFFKQLKYNSEQFWSEIQEQIKLETQQELIVVPEFRDLIQQMLQETPEKRPTIQQVINHQYFGKYEQATQEETILFMETCYQYLKGSIDIEIEELPTFSQQVTKAVEAKKIQLQLTIQNPNSIFICGAEIEQIEKIICAKISNSDNLFFMDDESEKVKWLICDMMDDSQVGINLLQQNDGYNLLLLNIKGKQNQIQKLKKCIRELLFKKI